MPGTVCWFILDSSFIIYKFGKSPFVLLGYSRTQGTKKRIHLLAHADKLDEAKAD